MKKTIFLYGLLALLCARPAAWLRAQEPVDYPFLRPLTREEFRPISLPGIGDRHNSWGWAMKWYKDRLYVGFGRAFHCAEIAGYARIPLINLFFQYPPDDPDVECTPDPLDLPLQAEIWRWTPEEDLWERVYQAPLVEIPHHPGRMTGRDFGYRDMVIFQEADGTEALYVMGVTPNSIFPDFPPPRLLRTTDGEHFEAVPQDPGTFLGDLNQDNLHSSFRAPSIYKGRLFLETGIWQGNGELIESSDPARGNDSFRMVLPPETRIYTTTVFNGYLYLGIQDQNGFQIAKTLAEGDPPYELIPVVSKGGFDHFVPLRTSNTVLYMDVYDGRIWAGTDKPAEILRVNPDDTWDLVMGFPRMSEQGWKYPLSGYGQGFNSTLNHHLWRLESYNGWLYLGTADAGTSNFKDTFLGDLLEPYMGFDLFATRDGTYMYEISRSGFENKFNFGVRALERTPFGLYLGTANNWYGSEIWWGSYRGSEDSREASSGRQDSPVEGPRRRSSPASRQGADRLEAERLGSEVLLSWEMSSGDSVARVYRRNWNTRDPSFHSILETKNAFCTLDAPPPNFTHAYKVVVQEPNGRLSPPSNVVVFPNAGLPVCCEDLLERMGDRNMRLALRGFPQDGIDRVRAAIEALSENPDPSRIRHLHAELEPLHRHVTERLSRSNPAGQDFELILSRLLRRIRLAEAGVLPARALRRSEPVRLSGFPGP